MSCTVFFWNQNPRISRPCCTCNEKRISPGNSCYPHFFLSYCLILATHNKSRKWPLLMKFNFITKNLSNCRGIKKSSEYIHLFGFLFCVKYYNRSKYIRDIRNIQSSGSNRVRFALHTLRLFQIYRVFHSKEEKMILLWWGYRFWFLLIFWVLCVYEIGPFMPNSPVFIFLKLRNEK